MVKPEQPSHVSFSATNGRKASHTFPVRRVIDLVGDNGHEASDLFILKMDIEGFEYQVLPDLFASGIYPRQILVEFHHGMYGFSTQDTRKAVQLLNEKGYDLFHVADTGREYSFILPQTA